jgi:AbrB family looped-hinge helix DNA binding protein
MKSVIISPKFQIVIPREIRETLQLSPGQKVQVIVYGNRIELIPERKIKKMRGFLKGINTNIERELDRV